MASGLLARVVVASLDRPPDQFCCDRRLLPRNWRVASFWTAGGAAGLCSRCVPVRGTPGLPDRALAFDLRQAAVYLFHNGPERKVFIDGRLEVPDRSTFDTYARLDQLLLQGRPGWAEPVRRMGNPLILLDHQEHYSAEATLLADTGWRCIHFDAVGSVFVSRHRRELERSFPSVDFAARHFDLRGQTSRIAPAGASRLGEAKAYYSAGWRFPMARRSPGHEDCVYMLLAGDLLREAIASNATAGGEWLLLGSACWSMVPSLTAQPPGPADDWDPATGLLPAQATYCYRRALEQYPGDVQALSTLLRSFEARKMTDARQSTASALRRAEAVLRGADVEAADVSDSHTDVEGKLHWSVRDDELDDVRDREALTRAVSELLRSGQAEKAVRLHVEAEDRRISPVWATRDHVALALLHLGLPSEARRIWEKAPDPPSSAAKLTRLATASLAALDFMSAEEAYLEALAREPARIEAWFGLALSRTQRGDAPGALDAARKGLRQTCTPAQTSFLRCIESLTDH